jgi:hypothetical protein
VKLLLLQNRYDDKCTITNRYFPFDLPAVMRFLRQSLEDDVIFLQLSTFASTLACSTSPSRGNKTHHDSIVADAGPSAWNCVYRPRFTVPPWLSAPTGWVLRSQRRNSNEPLQHADRHVVSLPSLMALHRSAYSVTRCTWSFASQQRLYLSLSLHCLSRSGWAPQCTTEGIQQTTLFSHTSAAQTRTHGDQPRGALSRTSSKSSCSGWP